MQATAARRPRSIEQCDFTTTLGIYGQEFQVLVEYEYDRDADDEEPITVNTVTLEAIHTRGGKVRIAAPITFDAGELPEEDQKSLHFGAHCAWMRS